LDQKIRGQDSSQFSYQSQDFPPRATAIGSLLEAITDPTRAEHFQPTNINFGLFPALDGVWRDKKLKKQEQIRRAQNAMREYLGFSHPVAPPDNYASLCLQ
jgi:folate-dependent tRNA-U54 methylase TrmFO/GidA